MPPVPPNLYTRWRVVSPGWLALRESAVADSPPERLLQLIWLHQRVRREALTTLDGRPLTVLHPGFWNREAGPDFRQAVIQFDREAPVSGDVEVDVRPECWRQHRHHENPAFAEVRLHVVWSGQAPGPLPTLALGDQLDAPLPDVESWLATEAAAASLGIAQAGRCATPLRELLPAAREELLRQAAWVRFERKAGAIAVRARAVGWDRALWEGLFSALGYKRNTWPMRRLAELSPKLLATAGGMAEQVLVLQALLLGVAGFLPIEPPRTAGAGAYWRRLWDVWWREQAALDGWVLPRSLWRLHGIRPANHPQRRIALAAHWLAEGQVPRRLEAWVQRPVLERDLVSSLLGCLQVGHDGFWSHHWTLNSRATPGPHPLLGEARCSDLAVNVILPWLWSRATVGGDPSLSAQIEQRYFAWPAGEDNAVLKLACRRLLGPAPVRLPPQAAAQQGLLQIVRDFCDHANAICEGCRFPELVRTLVVPASDKTEPSTLPESSTR